MFLNEEHDRIPAIAPKEALVDNLSGLLRQAVRDSQKIEKTPGYRLNMEAWHQYFTVQDICFVCMAGAVMACTIGFERTRTNGIGPINQLTREQQAKIRAINNMRAGLFGTAFSELRGDCGLSPVETTAFTKAAEAVHVSYTVGVNRANWESYLKAADILEAAGL